MKGYLGSISPCPRQRAVGLMRKVDRQIVNSPGQLWKSWGSQWLLWRSGKALWRRWIFFLTCQNEVQKGIPWKVRLPFSWSSYSLQVPAPEAATLTNFSNILPEIVVCALMNTHAQVFSFSHKWAHALGMFLHLLCSLNYVSCKPVLISQYRLPCSNSCRTFQFIDAPSFT